MLLASRLAAAIENARLFERARSQADTLLLLNEVGREASSILDVEALLRRAAELVKRVIDYQIMSILLYDQRHQPVSAAAGREVRPERAGQAARAASPRASSAPPPRAACRCACRM